jgi:hypothetical protein
MEAPYGRDPIQNEAFIPQDRGISRQSIQADQTNIWPEDWIISLTNLIKFFGDKTQAGMMRSLVPA